jgi:hypothetical protein
MKIDLNDHPCQPPSLTPHQWRQESERDPSEQPPGGTDSEENLYDCPYCEQAMPSFETLQGHITESHSI